MKSMQGTSTPVMFVKEALLQVMVVTLHMWHADT